jgi:hypothetical protein
MASTNRSVSVGAHEWHQLVADALMVSLAMLVGHELGGQATKMPLPSRTTRSSHSSLIDHTNRSASALQLGARNGVRMI